MEYSSFDDDIDVSHEPSYQLEIETFYKQFFGVMTRLTIRRVSGAEDKNGHDVVIKLDTGQCLKILEKHDRYKNTGNIVLEIWSDINHKKGWLYTSQCDWLAYHYDAMGITHLIPMPALRKAWNKYEAEWRDTYQIMLRENRGWTTQIILIPLIVLWEALHDVMIHDHLSGDSAKWI